jgi:adenylate cyclase, class 2
MAREIEVKLPVQDSARLRGLLKRMGAQLASRGVGRVHEWNTVFDTGGEDLRQRRQLLRVRIETAGAGRRKRARNAAQPALLTFKGPDGRTIDHAGKSRASHHKVREEIELRVQDAAALAQILERLGMRATVRYEKYRTTFRLPRSKTWSEGLLIEWDETPIGIFLELEGPAKAIDRAAKELGFSKKDYILKNYLRLNAEHCRRRGVEPGDMVFRKRN